MKKIINYVDEQLEQERFDGALAKQIKSNIKINNLSFAYGNNEPIFKDINIEIKEKSFVHLILKNFTHQVILVKNFKP